MLRDPTQYKRLMLKVKDIFDDHSGLFLIQGMAPGTKFTSIFDFVASAEDKAGRKMDLLVVDYADRLAGWAKDNSYKEMEEVYEGLRLYGEQNQLVVATASQAKRGAKVKWPMDEDDFADSIAKGRVVDDVFSINMKKSKDDGTEEFCIYIAKRRNGGNARIFGTDPFKPEWMFGRMGPWSDKFKYKVPQPSAEDLQLSRGPCI
jgi:dsDNA-binding SOS-regulon protein